MQEALEMSASKSSILGPWLVRRAASSKSILFDNRLDNDNKGHHFWWPLFSSKLLILKVVRKRGFEPPRGCPRQPLKLVRLPFRHFRVRGWVRAT